MRTTTQTDQVANGRSAGAAPHQDAPGMGPDVSFVGRLLRLARLHSSEAVAEKPHKDTMPSCGRQDPGSDVARASMEAGLTRGASVLFGGRR